LQPTIPELINISIFYWNCLFPRDNDKVITLDDNFTDKKEMVPGAFFKKLLLGINLPQEYICVGKEDLSSPLKVFLYDASHSRSFDITDQHLFLGYKPLIIGIPLDITSEAYHLLCSNTTISLLLYKNSGDSAPVALLELEFHARKNFNGISLFLFIGVKGTHVFLSSFYQVMNRLYHLRKRQNENNIKLNGNLYDQVRIAYSLPRLISIVSLGDGTNYNMFPTDLNGCIDVNHYVISLRSGGEANEQVGSFKQICISTVASSFYKEAYQMGRNHMQPLKPLSTFGIYSERSNLLKFPLPQKVLGYRELEHIDSIEIGIHRLHFFNVVQQKVIATGGARLSHVHSYYVSWSLRQGDKTKYLV